MLTIIDSSPTMNRLMEQIARTSTGRLPLSTAGPSLHTPLRHDWLGRPPAGCQSHTRGMTLAHAQDGLVAGR